MTIHQGRSSKILDGAPKFKSFMKIPNNFSAPSPSEPVIARSAEQNKICIGIFCTPKQSQTKKHYPKNNVLDCDSNMGLLHQTP